MRMRSHLFACLSCFILFFAFTYECQNCQHFVEKIIFSLWHCTLVKNQLAMCKYICGIYYFSFYFVCILSQITPCIEFCSFIVSLKIRECDSSNCILIFSIVNLYIFDTFVTIFHVLEMVIGIF